MRSRARAILPPKEKETKLVPPREKETKAQVVLKSPPKKMTDVRKFRVKKPKTKKTRVYSPPQTSSSNCSTPAPPPLEFVLVDATAVSHAPFMDPTAGNNVQLSIVKKGVFNFGLTSEVQASLLGDQATKGETSVPDYNIMDTIATDTNKSVSFLQEKSSNTIVGASHEDDLLSYAVGTKTDESRHFETKRSKVTFSASSSDESSSSEIPLPAEEGLKSAWGIMWDESKWPQNELVFEDRENKPRPHTTTSSSMLPAEREDDDIL
jgi:hypothetical protein